ncbi:MAG: ABC transporter ATP-binding protein [Ignavibacteriales bacterium]
MGVILETQNLSMSFGGIRACKEFDFRMEEGELVGLIGPNGAGKTTVFNLITGVYRPTEGKVLFLEHDITGLVPYRITRLGIARTFQNIRLFGNLTVLDNVKVAYSSKRKTALLSALRRDSLFGAEERAVEDASLVLLDRFGLLDRREELARNLPYGEQRKLEIARALAVTPRLLLLDEPAAGMNPSEAEDLINLVQRVRREFGVTVLIIEHQMRVIMRMCERIRVMDFGETIAEGTPGEIQSNPRVIAAYLGRRATHAAGR